MVPDLFSQLFDRVGLEDQSAFDGLHVVLVPVDHAVADDGNAETDQRLRSAKFFVKDHPGRRARIGERRDVELNGGLVEEVAARIVGHLRFGFIALAEVVDHDGVRGADGRRDGA